MKEVAINSRQRVKKTVEALALTAKAAEKLASLERAETKKREFFDLSGAYEKEKSRLKDFQLALGHRFKKYQKEEAEQSSERGEAAKRLSIRTSKSSMLFEAWSRNAWDEVLRRQQGGPNDTTDAQQQLVELDTARQRARRVFEDNADGSKASAEATGRFVDLGMERLELVKVMDRMEGGERLDKIKYEERKIALEGEMARLRSDQDNEDDQIMARDGFNGPRPAEPKLVVVESSPELRAAMGEGSGVKLVSAHSRMEIESKKKGPAALAAPKENGRLGSDGETFMFETDSLPALMRRIPVGVKQAPRDFEREKRAKTTSRKTSRPPSGDPDSSGEGSEDEDSDSGSSSAGSEDDDEDGAEGSSGGSQAGSSSSRCGAYMRIIPPIRELLQLVRGWRAQTPYRRISITLVCGT